MKKAICLAIGLMLAISAHAGKGRGINRNDDGLDTDGSRGRTISTSLPLQASMRANVSAEGCNNNPGPFITIQGELLLGGLDGRLTFSNNARGTHTHEEHVTVDVSLLPAGDAIQFAKQPSDGGVGGNPYIYIQFFDQDWSPASEAILLGRCVQGLNPVDLATTIPTDVTMTATAEACRNSGGPFISLDGEVRLAGLNARLIFRNNEIGTHEHDEFVGVELVIIPAGESIFFSKQPPEGGAGGNPHIFLEFLSNGEPVGEKFYLGRCNNL